MHLVYINNVGLPNPTKYSVPLSDLDSSDTSRNELGELVRNRVRQGIRKIELSWVLRGSQVPGLLKLIKPAKFRVRFLDPNTFTYQEANMYVGDRSCSMKLYTDDMDVDETLWDISFNLIEY